VDSVVCLHLIIYWIASVADLEEGPRAPLIFGKKKSQKEEKPAGQFKTKPVPPPP